MISVVISTLNRPDLLRRCLEALVDGTTPPAEVVVVNQGDRDAVENVILEATARGLHVVHVPQGGRGLSRSQNEGLRTASTPIVAVVDDDCVPAVDWVEVIERVFASNDAPDLVGGRILPAPIEGDRTVAVSTRSDDRPTTFTRPVAPWRVGSGGNFAGRRELLLRVGGNDERLGTGSPGRAGNDLDLFHRVMRAGGKARYEPAMLVHHRRATVQEHRDRRGSYGFGVGVCVGRWLRDHDRSAARVLLSWLRLRATLIQRDRTLATLANEARVLGGTLLGIAHGVRLGGRWPTPLG